MVSCVVKVFDATVNSVVSGWRVRRCRQVRGVDVGYKVHTRAPVYGERAQGCHGWTKVRSADADVDDVGNSKAGEPVHRPLRTFSEKRVNVLKRGTDIRHHVVAVDWHWLVGAVAKRDVHHGAVLRAVNRLAGEHPIAQRLDAGLARQIDERAENGTVDALFGEIEQKIVKGDAELLEPRRIVSEFRSGRSGEHTLAQAVQFRQRR